MVHRKLVEKALEHHVNAYPGSCDDCPYEDITNGTRCIEQLLKDVQTILLAEDVTGERAINVHGSNLHLLKDPHLKIIPKEIPKMLK